MKKETSSFDLIKHMNIQTVFRAIIENRPVSRVEISEKTGLNKMTVTNCVKWLMEQGMVLELEESRESSGVGRPPIALDLDAGFGCMIGIELNIISCKIMLCDFAGNILDKRVEKDIGINPQAFVAAVEEEFKCCASKSINYRRGVLGISIAVPGNYNYDSGIIEYISNMPLWNGYRLRESLTERLPNIPFFFQNAGRAGAKGELCAGKILPDDSMIYIQGAMGLTVSMYSNQRTHVGSRGFSGRFGHTIVQPNGRKCSCGNSGCLEMYGSTHAICSKLYPQESVSDDMIKKIIESRDAQEPHTLAAIDEAIHYLAIGLANIINCFNPRHVCIGNYLGMILSGQENRLNDEINQYLLPHYREYNRVLISGLGEWGAALGAVATIRDSTV